MPESTANTKEIKLPDLKQIPRDYDAPEALTTPQRCCLRQVGLAQWQHVCLCECRCLVSNGATDGKYFTQ